MSQVEIFAVCSYKCYNYICINRQDKLLTKFLEKPNSLSYREIEKLLIAHEFTKAQAAGSHVKFRRKNMPNNLIIAVHNGDCKDYLKKQAAIAIKTYAL